VRVIAGTARGIVLAAPRGDGTRPISDRVKEALFGSLGARVLDARVLDLYAGSGAAGIEALSRGAAHATFVEHHRPAAQTIRANLALTGFTAVATVEVGDVLRFLGTASGPWDVVVLDPPYEERRLGPPMEAVTPHLDPRGIVVVKHFWRTTIPDIPSLAVTRTRRFGETALAFLEPHHQREEER
jgi:16S rRNA (guanine966-N2)-methyltransferase